MSEKWKTVIREHNLRVVKKGWKIFRRKNCCRSCARASYYAASFDVTFLARLDIRENYSKVDVFSSGEMRLSESLLNGSFLVFLHPGNHINGLLALCEKVTFRHRLDDVIFLRSHLRRNNIFLSRKCNNRDRSESCKIFKFRDLEVEHVRFGKF